MNIKAANGCYVTAENGGGIDPRINPNLVALRANRTVAGPWETFNIINLPNGQIAIQTNNGNYITAELSGGTFLRTDATTIGPWETFTLIQSGAGFALLCNNNYNFICCEVGSNDPVLNATRSILGPWETFYGVEANPSRDEIIHVNANSCNLRDSDDWPIFDPFIDWLIFNNLPKAEDWVTRLKGAGSSHINIDLSGDYNEPLGWAPRYPIPGTDWTNDLTAFKQILDWVINKGFIPIVHLAADGQGYDPVGKTYGWKWGMDNLPRILSDLQPYWKKCLWNTGWDGCFPNWSVSQFEQFLLMLRSVLGDDAQIATEFAGPGEIGYIHLGNGQADWDTTLQNLDAFFTELQVWPCPDDPIAQVATRLLGPAATNCPQTPYYLSAPRARGECGICYFETLMYWAIRKYATPYDATIASQQGAYYGFTNFGNGLA